MSWIIDGLKYHASQWAAFLILAGVVMLGSAIVAGLRGLMQRVRCCGPTNPADDIS